MTTCEHYTRRCALITPCCKKIYPCRFCHDDQEEHQLIRKDVNEIKCIQCGTIQNVSEKCVKCEIRFGRYCCLVCRLFDDTDKQQFHCQDCGICRAGGRENFSHCNGCGTCLSKGIKETHKCIEDASRTNCPVCLEDVHSSTLPSFVPPCGHMIHWPCYGDLMKSRFLYCPLCLAPMSNS